MCRLACSGIWPPPWACYSPMTASSSMSSVGFASWHLPLIRQHLGITGFSDGGRRVVVRAMLDASRSKDILADIINVGIEALVHARYDLPAFSTLRRAAQKARAQINHGYYHQVHAALD